MRTQMPEDTVEALSAASEFSTDADFLCSGARAKQLSQSRWETMASGLACKQICSHSATSSTEEVLRLPSCGGADPARLDQCLVQKRHRLRHLAGDVGPSHGASAEDAHAGSARDPDANGGKNGRRTGWMGSVRRRSHAAAPARGTHAAASSDLARLEGGLSEHCCLRPGYHAGCAAGYGQTTSCTHREFRQPV